MAAARLLDPSEPILRHKNYIFNVVILWQRPSRADATRDATADGPNLVSSVLNQSLNITLTSKLAATSFLHLDSASSNSVSCLAACIVSLKFNYLCYLNKGEAIHC